MEQKLKNEIIMPRWNWIGFGCLVLALCAVSVVSGSVVAQDGSAPGVDWEEVYTDGSGVTETEAMVQTADGGYVIAGHYTPDSSYGVDKDLRQQEGRVLKIASDGSVVWDKKYGDAGFDTINAVARTSDGGYILAGSSWGKQDEEAWVVKIRSDGTVQWQNKYGDSADSLALSVVETTDGGYAFGGWKKYEGGNNIPNGWLVKVDSSGAKQWGRTYGGDEGDKIQTVIETDSGGFALAGWSDSFASQGDDMWLIRTDETGDKQWDRTYSNSDDDGAFGEGLIQTNDGGFALAGWTTQLYQNMWLVKVDESGNQEWNERYRPSGNGTATSVIQTSDGDYVLSGYTQSYEGDYDGWLLKADGTDGSRLWGRLYGSSSTDATMSVVANADGSYTLAGYVSETQSTDAYRRDMWTLNTEGSDSTAAPPTAAFEPSTTEAVTDESITFDPSGTDPGDGVIDEYQWSFDDGTTTETTTGTSVTHSFDEADTYNIKLTVSGTTGSDSITKTVTTTEPEPPTASLATNPNPIANVSEKITFYSSGSEPGDGTIEKYKWSFGDGTTTETTDTTVTHSYDTAGDYTPKLTVIGTTGTDNDTASLTIEGSEPPTAALTTNPNPIADVGELITFQAGGSESGDGTIKKYKWSFGDGTTTETTDTTVTHSYDTAGDYTPKLTVIGTTGTDNDTASLTIEESASPTASFTPSTTDATVGESVAFDASGSTPDDGTIKSYKWSFGDGTTETTTDPTISHAYDDSDEYTVTLNISGTTGSDVTTKTISVDSEEPEVTKPTFSRDGALFGFDPYPVEVGEVPVVRVTTRNAESVSLTATVDGQSVTLDMYSRGERNSGEETWRVDLGTTDSIDFADLDTGDEVDVEITATNQTKQTTISSFYTEDQNPYLQDEDLPSSTDFDYYVFNDVKEIGIVFSKFKNSVGSTPENMNIWKQTNERAVNNYFGSGYGSMGAIGYDFKYYGDKFYQLPNSRTYYEHRSEADWIDENLGETADEEGRCEPYPTDARAGIHVSCGFHLVQDDTRDQSEIDPEEYYYWITLFPNESIANPDTRGGLGIGAITFDQENIVSPIGEGRNTLVHEMIHAKPIYASHPVPEPRKQVIEKPNNRELSDSPISIPTRVGLGNYNTKLIPFFDKTYKVPSGINWIDRDVETFSSKNANTIVRYKHIKNYEFGDKLPIVHIDKDKYENLNLYDDRYVVIEGRQGDGNDHTVPVMNVIKQTNRNYFGYKIIETSSTEGIAGRIYPPFPDDPSGTYQLENGIEITYQELNSHSQKAEISIEANEQNTKVVSINQNIQHPELSSDIESHSHTSPDLDLVAIDSQGRRVGVTESGDYVNEIPGANASGNTDSFEWISVPKDIDVEYKVLSDDVEEYINQASVSEENVTVNYESSIATYGDDPDIVSQNGNFTITNGTTEQGKNETIEAGASTSAVNDTAIAGFNIVPLSPEPTQPVTLNGSLATSLNGTIESYEWTYGNNSTTTGQTLNRNYSTTGDYEVTLSVTDSNGATDNITRTIDVTDSPPQAILNTTTDGSVTEGTQVTFSARQSSDYLGITEYRWDMDGDNETEQTTNATTPVINYTYSTPGTYEPTVTVVDTANQTATASRTLNVTARESSGGGGGGGGGGGAGGAGGAGGGGGQTEQGPPSIQAVESTLQLVSPTATTSVPLEDTDSSQNGLTVTPTDPATVEEVTFNNADLSGTVEVTEYTEPPATISEDVAASVAAEFNSQSSSDTTLSDPSEISVLAVTDIAPTVAATEDSSATVELSIDADQVDNPGQLRVIKETYSEEAQATRWKQLAIKERLTAGDEITMTVEVDSFSLFAITEVDGATQTSDTETTGQDPDTGESGGIGIAGIVGVVAVVLIAGVALYLRD